MALTQPFINKIRAFNGPNGTTVSFGILGGDAVTGARYSIYENATGNIITLASNGTTSLPITISNDTAGETIRTYSFEIPQNILLNNYAYKIQVQTYNSTEQSIYSNYEIFSCYVEPSFAIQYYNGTSYVNLSSGYIVSSPNLQIQLLFNKNDNYSNAILNKANVYLYGVRADNTQDLVFSGSTLYNEPLTQTVENFSPTNTQDSIYQSFLLSVEGETVDGMQFISQVSRLLCNYAVSTEDLLTASNDCSNGNINITIKLPTGQTVSSAVLQYKKETDIDWITLQNITINNWTIANLVFNYCGANTIYNFRILFLNSTGSTVVSDTATVLSSFSQTYICDSINSYNILLDNGLSSVQRSNQTAVYQPYGSEYFIMTKNALLKGISATSTAILLASTTKSANSSYIDRMAQVKLKDEFNNWLSNGKTKILKDFNGNIFIIGVSGAIENTFYKELGNGIASTNFSWVELGDFTQQYLSSLGMTNNFQINYIS